MDAEHYNVFNCDFSLLPPHVTTQILGYLKFKDFKKAKTVCKSWHYASTDPQLIRTLVLAPTDKNLLKICKSNRRYGILRLQYLKFDKQDEYYFKLYEKFCPFVYELDLTDSNLKLNHLLKLLELTTHLELISFSEYSVLLAKLSSLFPSEFDCEVKNRIVTNLSGVKTILMDHFINIPLIADILRYAPNLKTFRFNYEFYRFHDRELNLPYRKFLTIFDNYDAVNLKHLYLNLYFDGPAGDFITHFIKIKNLHLKSFHIVLDWFWADWDNKSTLCQEFLLKLHSLEKFTIWTDTMIEDQLSNICQNLVNLKSLDCFLEHHQPISELKNLQKLENLHCRYLNDRNRQLMSFNIGEIDKFFKCKFEHLRTFEFDVFVNEPNLERFCENHPNLIELRLSCLQTSNLQPIFKHLTKLRSLSLSFRFETGTKYLWRLNEYRVSRLQDLKEFYLGELVNGIIASDLKQLKKLRHTNVRELIHMERKFMR